VSDNLPTEQQLMALNKPYKIGDKEVKPTAKQFTFVSEYLVNGNNATQAAISAGYSEKTARFIAAENLSKPIIKQMLSEMKQVLLSRYIMSYDEKRAKLGQIVEIGTQEREVKNKKGKKLGVVMMDPHNAIKAIQEDNKMAGHIQEKEQHSPEIHIHLTKVDMAL